MIARKPTTSYSTIVDARRRVEDSPTASSAPVHYVALERWHAGPSLMSASVLHVGGRESRLPIGCRPRCRRLRLFQLVSDAITWNRRQDAPRAPVTAPLSNEIL